MLSSEIVSAKPSPPLQTPNKAVLWLSVLALVYCLILAVGFVGAGFNWVAGGAEGAKKLPLHSRALKSLKVRVSFDDGTLQ